MNRLLEGKCAVITGAGSGVGQASSLRFAEEGARVVCADINVDSAKETVQQIEAAGGTAIAVGVDVSSEDQVVAMIDAAAEQFGRLDILFNNVGIPTPRLGVSLEDHTLEDFQRLVAINFGGVFFGCKHAVRAMKEKGGTIVNVSSIASLQGEPYNIAYSAAKGAVEAMTRSIAVHCVQMRYPIRCNSLHPGPIRTSLAAELPAKFEKARAQGFVMPPGFAAITSYSATPEEIAPSVLYLASAASMWVNGARLVIDHTQSITRGSVPV